MININISTAPPKRNATVAIRFYEGDEKHDELPILRRIAAEHNLALSTFLYRYISANLIEPERKRLDDNMQG